MITQQFRLQKLKRKKTKHIKKYVLIAIFYFLKLIFYYILEIKLRKLKPFTAMLEKYGHISFSGLVLFGILLMLEFNART